MEEWKEYKLGEVAIPVRDRIDTSVLDASSYISTENMLPDKAGVTLSSGVPSGKAIQFKEGDILISNIRPYFKKIWRADKVGGCSADIICLRASKEVEPLFFYYLLSQDMFFNYVMQGAKGTKMPRGDRNQIMLWPVLLPSKSEQQKIALILSALDDKIEVNKQINDNLEQQAQALFKAWFIDFAPFVSGDFVESELGLIPKDWKVLSLSAIANYTNGLAMQKYRPTDGESGLPVLKIKELGQGRTDESSELCSPSLIGSKYIIDDGDIIFSWSGTLMVKVWCGGKCGLNQHLFVVEPKEHPHWFVYLWTKHHLDNFIHIAKDKAVTMGHIKRGELDKAKVVVPDETNLATIDLMMKPLHDQIISNMKESRRLASLRDTLLPRLMSGELKVNEIENVI
jgi:type I restriction enzyme S subunit